MGAGHLMKNLGIVIQARMHSSRLPGKVLIDFCGKPMLLFQAELLKTFNLDAEVVIATTENPLDDNIKELCDINNIPYIRGSEENVFQRFCLVAKRFRFDHIVRLTGDNPLTNYRLITTCLKKHREKHPDLTTTRKILPDRSVERYVPKGNSIDVIDCKTLLSIDPDSLDDFEKEHVIPVFFNGQYHVSYVKDYRPGAESLSVDDLNDFEKVSQYARNCLKKGTLFQELGFPGK